MRKLILALVVISVCFWGGSAFANNYALQFDGPDNYVFIPDSDSLDLSAGMTIEAWINPYHYTGPNVIVSKYSPYIFKLHNDGSGKLRIEIDNRGPIVADLRGESVVPLNSWSHVATTFDSNTMRLFLNGQPDGSQSPGGSIQISDADLYIGSVNSVTGNENFNGLLDEVRIWNYARTPEQLNQWKNFELTGSEAGLVGYWNFNEGNGNALGDSTGFGNIGQIFGAQWVSSDSPVTVTPEPASMFLFGIGSLAMAALKRKKLGTATGLMK